MVLSGLSIAVALFGCRGGEAPAPAVGNGGASTNPATTSALTLNEYQETLRKMARAMNAEMEPLNAKMGETVKSLSDPAKRSEAMKEFEGLMVTAKSQSGARFAELAAVTPPAELKEFHRAATEGSAEILEAMGNLIDALKAGDVAQVKVTIAGVSQKVFESDQKQFKALEEAGFDVLAYRKDLTLVKKAK
jgi:hypothetical protein